jgi:hypothetical protein
MLSSEFDASRRHGGYIPVEDDDTVAERSEAAGGGPADAIGSARNDHYPS